MTDQHVILYLTMFIIYIVTAESLIEPEQGKDRKFGFNLNFQVDDEPDPVKSVREKKSKPDRSSRHKVNEHSLLIDYVYYKEASGFFKLYDETLNWMEARLKCDEAGAELASPETESLLRVLTTIMVTSARPPPHVFTGINDLYSKGFFRSLKGTPLHAMPARRPLEEPYNIDHEHNCLTMQRNGMLKNSKCTGLGQFICYKREASLDETRCGSAYKYNTQTQACYKYNSIPARWSDAYAVCARDGGHLLVVNGDAEADLDGLLSYGNNTKIFVGASHWNLNLYKTIYGYDLEESGFARWAPGYPASSTDNRCVALEGGALTVEPCSGKLTYVCEKHPFVTF